MTTQTTDNTSNTDGALPAIIIDSQGCQRDHLGRLLKGSKGPNPGGRPKGLAAKIRAELADGQELIDGYLAIWRNPKSNTRDKLAAGDWLTERGFGRLPEIQLQGELDSETVAGVAELSSDDLRDLLRTLKASNDPGTELPVLST
jgi:hypothetical protein